MNPGVPVRPTLTALLRPWVPIMPLVILALVIDRQIAHPAGGWKIAYYTIWFVAWAFADVLSGLRGKTSIALSNGWYWALMVPIGFATPLSDFLAGQPGLTLVWCFVMTGIGMAAGITAKKERPPTIFDRPDWLSRSLAVIWAAGVVMFFGATLWFGSWVLGMFWALGITMVPGLPLSVVAIRRQRVRNRGAAVVA